jgi:hypothetical protein
MSLTLVFRSTTNHNVGPLGSFRLDGDALRTSDGGLVARHERNAWRIDGDQYPRVECKGSVSIWFERASTTELSRRFGPLDELAIYDGVAYIGQRVFASLDEETRNWYSHEIGHHWRVMVVEAAAAAGTARP